MLIRDLISSHGLLKLQRSAELLVDVQQDGCVMDAVHLEGWLQDPERFLRQLLSGEQLESLGSGEFRYEPRTLELPGYSLKPEVHLKAICLPQRLELHLLSYRLVGLVGLERKARYRFSAELTPAHGRLALRARAELELATGKDGLRLPAPLLAFLGRQALGLIFGRLERRSRRNLRHGPERKTNWL